MHSIKKILFSIIFLIFSTVFLWADNSSNAKVFLDQGINFFKQERYFEAIDSFRNAIENNPSYGDAYKYMGEVYFALGEFNASLENALMAIRYANNDVDAMLILANSYREVGNYDKSENYYKKVIDISPSYAEVYRNLGELYLKMNKLPLALSMLNKADRMNKNYWRNYISFGNYYLKNNNPEKAEELYKKAFNLNPTERMVYVTLADYFSSTGNYSNAITLLENGEKIFDNFYSGIVILADCYLNTGNFQKAIEKYDWINQAGVKKDKDFKSWIFYKMGIAYEAIDKDKSVASYHNAIEAYPKNEFFQSALEYFAIKNFKIDSPIRKELAYVRLSNATAAYNNGETKIYFFNLKRAASLYPFLTEARQKLVNYFELNNDLYHAYLELKSLEKVDTGYKIKDKIENYEWKLKNNQIRLEEPSIYKYRGLLLVDADLLNYSSIYSDSALFNSLYYNKFKLSTLDFRKKQGINYILEYLRENDYSFFIIVTVYNSNKSIRYSIYDKTGKVIEEQFATFNTEEMSKSIVHLMDWIDGIFPSIWKIGNEVSPNNYALTAGTADGTKKNDDLTAFDLSNNRIEPLSLLKVSKAEPYYSEVTVVSNLIKGEYFNLKDKYTVNSGIIRNNWQFFLKRILGY